jgi:hypothetical protein
MTSATITLPPVTPAFQQAVRELAMQVGWRNVAKRIAYGPTQNEPVAPSNGNGHRHNGHKRASRKLWWTVYPAEYEMARRIKYDSERWLHNDRLTQPFKWALPAETRFVDKTSERLALYPKEKCCGSIMGIMECWGDSPNIPIRAVYQCAVNPVHQKRAYAR